MIASSATLKRAFLALGTVMAAATVLVVGGLTNGGGGGGVGFTVQQASAQCVTEERGFEIQTECKFEDVETSNERRGEDFGNVEGSGAGRGGLGGEGQIESRQGQPIESQFER
jgi:hypothetical protein